MIFSATSLAGVMLIRPEPARDERGFFARTHDVSELQRHGLDPEVVQQSVSFNPRRGTLRGMHYQIAPHEENKVVTCMRGAVYDVVVDIRKTSPTYRRWAGFKLSADTLESVFIPKGCAHGFITLEDDTLVLYAISAYHHPESARGFHHADPAFGIEWPMAPVVIGARDASYPPYAE